MNIEKLQLGSIEKTIFKGMVYFTINDKNAGNCLYKLQIFIKHFKSPRSRTNMRLNSCASNHLYLLMKAGVNGRNVYSLKEKIRNKPEKKVESGIQVIKTGIHL